MPSKNSTKNGTPNANESFAQALAEVSDRLTRLVHDEIELAKAEVAEKTSSIARGAAAVAAGAVFGVFAVIFFLLTLAWVLDGIFVSGAGSLWLGFLIVLVILVVLTAGAFMFAWKKLKVGAPTPKMAIDEGKKIKDTVVAFGNGNGNGNGHGAVSPEQLAQILSPVMSAVPVAPSPVPTVVPNPTEEPPTRFADESPVAVEPTFVVEPAEARTDSSDGTPSTGPEK